MRKCNHCGRHFKNKRALNIHIALMHRNRSSQDIFINDYKNNNHNNGNGIEALQESLDNVKDRVSNLENSSSKLEFDVENMKWVLKPFQQKKRVVEKKLEVDKNQRNFADCVEELKMRFGEDESK